MKNKVYKFLLCIIAVAFVFSSTTVAVSAVSSYESESNDNYNSADTIELGDTVSATLNYAGDNDYYKMVAPDNGKISVSFQHKYSDNNEGYKYWNLWIYQYIDGSYNELSYRKVYAGDNENIALPYIGAVKNCTYYVKVHCKNDDPVGENYSISTKFTKSDNYEKENNDDFYKANKIVLGKTISGTLNHGGDNDYYKIVSTQNGKISLNFKHKYSDNNEGYKYWNLWIYQYIDGSYNELSYRKVYAGDNENIALPYIGAVKNCTYYVKVHCKNDDPVGENYSISTKFTKSDNYEKENNDDFYKANKIVLGKTISGTLNHGGDNDYYKIIAPKKVKITLNFQHKKSDNNEGYKYWDLWVYQYSNGSYNELSYQRIYAGSDEKVNLPSINAVKNGVYYVKVHCKNDDPVGENYTIKASVYLNTPKLSKVSNSTNGIRITWNKVVGASGYNVYRKSGSGGWKKIGETKNLTYTDKTAKKGTTYSYTVRAYYGYSLSGYNTKGLSIKRLETPTLLKATSAKAGITVKWSKTTGASGYYLYRKIGNGAWKRIATINGISSVSYLDKSANKGTTYTYTVKAYSGKSTSAYNAKGLTIRDKY